MTTTTGDRTLSILKTLVAFDTTSRNANRPLIDWVDRTALRYGAQCVQFPNSDGSKANLLVTFGPTDVPGYLLSGHTDVVPIDGQNWSTDPFVLTVREGKAFGRGTVDMKGFLACCISSFPAIAAATLRAPILFAFSYDEEVDHPGVLSLVETLRDKSVKPLGVFVGEPSRMTPTIAHKSCSVVRVTVRGKAAHASLAPRAVNAIEWAARLIAYVQGLAGRSAADGPHDLEYDVPHATFNIGSFRGGAAANVVACEAVFTIDIRTLGSQDPHDYMRQIVRFAREQLEPTMTAIEPAAGFEFEQFPTLPGLSTALDHEIVRLAKRLASTNDHAKVAFGTEAGLFQRIAGIPTVVVGPGDIDQAHTADEFIEVAELVKCNLFLSKLIRYASVEPESIREAKPCRMAARSSWEI
jgi:acetylornithine deacetylase